MVIVMTASELHLAAGTADWEGTEGCQADQARGGYLPSSHRVRCGSKPDPGKIAKYL